MLWAFLGELRQSCTKQNGLHKKLFTGQGAHVQSPFCRQKLFIPCLFFSLGLDNPAFVIYILGKFTLIVRILAIRSVT